MNYTLDDRTFSNNGTENAGNTWSRFSEEQNYSSIYAFVDTAGSPIYNAFEEDTVNWINNEHNGIWPKDFISVKVISSFISSPICQSNLTSVERCYRTFQLLSTCNFDEYEL